MTVRTQRDAAEPSELDRLIPLHEVLDLTSFSKATIYRKIADSPPTFPAPRKIGKSRVAWRRSDIAKWLVEQPSTVTAGE